MQETRTIKLSPELISSFKHQADSSSILLIELDKNLQQINDMLVSYHFNKRERIIDPNIDKSTLRVNHDGKGTFLVRYAIGMFNACADVDFITKEKMQIEILVNFSASEAVLKGEFIPEREPDEI